MSIQSKTLHAENHVDLNREFRLRHVKNETEYFRPHDHDYCEIFLVLCGSAKHYVNGASFPISKGNLLFIRDWDLHDYHARSKDFEFLNLAFLKKTFSDMADFLGSGFDSSSLLSSPNPPCVRLSAHDTEKLRLSLAELHTDEPCSDETSCAVLKSLLRRKLTDIFFDRFSSVPTEESAVPFWLENAYEQMRKPKNFITGKERFFELSARSREHATRCLMRYYSVTPSDYVNFLRLHYAAGLLRSSNLSATDICYECGFHNVSWFYSIFEKEFGCSPIAYRKTLE